jgi:SAM-dependent methyltransferase
MDGTGCISKGRVTAMTIPFVCQICSGKQYTTLTTDIRDWEFGVEGVYEYRRCQDCGQVQIHPFPTIEQLKQAYPESYSSHVASPDSRGILYGALYRATTRLLQRRLRRYIRPGAVVLDVGCGNGEFLTRIRSMGATTLEGVDFSDKAARLAEEKGIRVFRGLFLDFPASEGRYDAVFMNNYIEHVLYPHKELDKAIRLLKDGGVLFGEVPNFDSLDRRVFGRYWGSNHVPRHTFQYDRGQLGKLFTDAGFKSFAFRYELNTGTLAASFQNFLQRNAPSLRNNPRLRYGRMKGFEYLLLACIPLNLIPWVMKRPGVMTFIAQK